MNRKRDAELMKMRKLLEDVHLESEETAHLLKKKHQEIVVDFNEQIEQLSKAKNRWENLFWIFFNDYFVSVVFEVLENTQILGVNYKHSHWIVMQNYLDGRVRDDLQSALYTKQLDIFVEIKWYWNGRNIFRLSRFFSHLLLT